MMLMLSWVRVLGVGACLWGLTGVDMQAQSGAITGRVADPQGESLAGVTVSAESSGAAPPVTVTDQDGRYEIGSLPPGIYRITMTLDRFSPERVDGVTIEAERVTLDVTLRLAPFAEQVRVVGVTPLLGSEIPRERIPATVSVIDGAALEARRAGSLADALHERLGAVTLEGTTTNLFQPTLRFRGFTASPLLGLPQGIAVYQNGVRINEAFGDTVQFDLMPQFAVARAQLSAGADPTYGLNALGGALALQLKNGFDHTGFRGEFFGGSFERLTGTAEYGANNGTWGLYVGATRFDEDGWRDESPSDVTQMVADLAYREGTIDAGVTLTYADTVLSGNGPAPIELLEVDRAAVFTFPDTTGNEMAFVQGRFNIAATPVWSVQVTGYSRHLERKTLNGDEAEFGRCDDDSRPAGAPGRTLCQRRGDDDDDDAVSPSPLFDDDDDEPEEHPLVDVVTGRFITDADAAGDGAFNRSHTDTEGYGATVQATGRGTLGGREHVFVLGASADVADIAFSSNSEVGTLTRDRTVAGSGLLAGIFGDAPDDIFNTDLDSKNRAVGLYFSETLSLTGRAHLTVAGRFNSARLEILDNLGTSLNGDHTFSRFNPSVGLVYDTSPRVSVFGRYSESNRAPTAAELSCADPAEPCRVPNAFISDPPLEQTAARSAEGGLRGRLRRGASVVDWSVSVYGTRIEDDILFVASPDLIGTGFFQNAGDTRRVGLDIEVTGQVARTGWYASYGLVDATFQSPLELPGNDEVNDATTGDGVIEVEPGDRLAGIPRHSFKAGVLQDLTSRWDVALETVAASSRVFFGDEGNDQAELDGYAIVNLRTTYRLSPSVEVVARVDNLFDTAYGTSGVLAELEVFLEEVPNASDPRFIGPGPPRSLFAGMRVTF